MVNAQFSGDQNGMQMITGEQSMIDGTQLPTPTTFDQGRMLTELYRTV